MNESKINRFQSFIRQVCEQMKAKEARPHVAREIRQHLEEKCTALQLEGYSREEAEDLAVKEMGNPIDLGQDFNKIHKPRIDWGLSLLFILILGLSMVPIYVLSVESGLQLSFEKKVLSTAIAIAVALCLLFFPYSVLLKWGVWFYTGGILLIILMENYGTQVEWKKMFMIFGLGVDHNVALFLFYLGGAAVLSRVRVYHTLPQKIKLLVILCLPLILLLFSRYLMYALMYISAIAAMLLVSKIDRKTLLHLSVGILVCTGLITTFFLMNVQYVYNRLAGFFSSASHPQAGGYQLNMSKVYLQEASWLNIPWQAPELSRLPDAHTNFIFVSVVHMFGWLVGILFVAILLFIIIRMGYAAIKTKDPFGRSLVVGGATMLLVATLWHVLMTFGLVPITSVSLPFISYGGIQLLFYSTLVGIILSVYRRKDLFPEEDHLSH
ncbi:FtsW/RodA/SpoVE family cell cycle protein [Caldalkalibacillus salinus]|uniref:FtsW/RodA/SpoVE family cell cycle protein n=1 Tax=Caldalkalibacillus salinus TaxID=2803787 RepID=UPI00192271C1|nr:FtsW/RodA/SpoVE family cell cycle protein [Caldalkalibacillus salinus]